MKKFLIVIGAILVIVIGTGVFLKSKGTSLLKTAIETNGSELLGVQVSLGDIALDILKGHVALSEFAIGQPSGFGEGKSFQVKNFSLDLEPLSLFRDHAKIDAIVIDKPQLNLVMIGKENNFSKLRNNLDDLISDEPSSSDMKLSIKDLRLNATHLSIKSDKYGEKEVTLADVHLENIGIDEKGVTPNEAVRLTLEALKPQIAKALIELGIKDKLGAEIDKQIGDKLKDLPVPLTDTLKSGLGGLLKKKKKDEQGPP